MLFKILRKLCVTKLRTLAVKQETIFVFIYMKSTKLNLINRILIKISFISKVLIYHGSLKMQQKH